MQIQDGLITSAPRDSATVLMLRDSTQQHVGSTNNEQGVEVFMIKRHAASSVLGGVYVFPGGKVDEQDASEAFFAHLDQDPAILRARLNESDLSPTQAAAIFIAAIREVWEESGVLYAKSNSLKNTELKSPAPESSKQSSIEPNSTKKTLLQHLNSSQLTLRTDDLIPFSRWITPQLSSVMSKRFDTRFFLSAHPHSQLASHDNFEASESAWLSPRKALKMYWDKEIELAPPQIMTLANLSNYKNVAQALEHARAMSPVTVRPEPYDLDGVRYISYPGHPKHSQPSPVMKGPRLLRFANQRFEPVEPSAGFEAFFEP